tara:strand:- start:33 stop:314 length:282 start_codon:yes stop_codon:yes gene_type:complete
VEVPFELEELLEPDELLELLEPDELLELHEPDELLELFDFGILITFDGLLGEEYRTGVEQFELEHKMEPRFIKERFILNPALIVIKKGEEAFS